MTKEEIDLYRKEYNTMINEIYGSGYGCLVRMLNEQTKINEGLIHTYPSNKNVTDFVYNTRKGILYHVTPSMYLKKIFKYGLMPKTYIKLSTHPDRVYFTMGEHMAKALIPILYNTIQNDLYKHLINEYSLLKIDLNRLSGFNSKPKFYLDPNCASAVYTHESINPNCIDILNKVKI